MDDTIYRQAAIEAIHGAIIDFFDICDDDEEPPMTYKDELLLKINKAISGRIKQLPSAKTEQKKGKWISKYNGKPVKVINGIPQDSCACSLCGKWLTASDEYAVIGNYCPYCGSFNGGTE